MVNRDPLPPFVALVALVGLNATVGLAPARAEYELAELVASDGVAWPSLAPQSCGPRAQPTVRTESEVPKGFGAWRSAS